MKNFKIETLIELFNDYVNEIVEKEKEIEEKKMILAQREDFNVYEIFKLCFDLKGTGFIDSDCLERIFDELEINYISSDNIELLI